MNRNAARRLETLFSLEGNVSERVSRHMQGLRILLQIMREELLKTDAVWSNGFSQRLENANERSLLNGATTRQWQQYDAAFKMYSVFMGLSLVDLDSLSLPDGLQPFAVTDLTALGELADLSLEQIAFREPEDRIEPTTGGIP